MINKEVKSSERESNSYAITRATPIDLKTIDSEVALLSGRATQTPISMEALWNEVQNLKNKKVTVFDFSTIGRLYNSQNIKLNINHEVTPKTKISGSFMCITPTGNGNQNYFKDVTISGFTKTSSNGNFNAKFYISNNEFRISSKSNSGGGNTFVGIITIYE